jgi:hypothetical protein
MLHVKHFGAIDAAQICLPRKRADGAPAFAPLARQHPSGLGLARK